MYYKNIDYVLLTIHTSPNEYLQIYFINEYNEITPYNLIICMYKNNFILWIHIK